MNGEVIWHASDSLYLKRSMIKQSNVSQLMRKKTDSQKKPQSKKLFIWCWCYKTFFGGNLDFPKIKKLKKVCYNVWICTKMWKLGYFLAKLTLELFIALEMVYYCCFSSGGNLDFLQKSFITLTTGRIGGSDYKSVRQDFGVIVFWQSLKYGLTLKVFSLGNIELYTRVLLSTKLHLLVLHWDSNIVN